MDVFVYELNGNIIRSMISCLLVTVGLKPDLGGLWFSFIKYLSFKYCNK